MTNTSPPQTDMSADETIEVELEPIVDNEPSDTADLLRTYLHHRDTLCPRCEYNLRNLTGDRCPECGLELELRVSATEPYLRPYIALMAGLSAAGGIGVFSVLLIFAEGWPRGLPMAFHVSFTYFIAMIPFAITGLTIRKWFTRLPKPAQRASAGIATGLCVLMLIILTIGIARN